MRDDEYEHPMHDLALGVLLSCCMVEPFAVPTWNLMVCTLIFLHCGPYEMLPNFDRPHDPDSAYYSNNDVNDRLGAGSVLHVTAFAFVMLVVMQFVFSIE